MSNIQWFPGHMQKAHRQMEEQLKLVDIIIELRDARAPLASSNPILLEMAKNKPRLIILNKADYADPNLSKKWVKELSKDNNVLLVDSVNENITSKLVSEVKLICKDKLEKAKARGIRNKVLRAMVCGIPNVGKSTFINNIVKKKASKAENRPGVTKALQWVRINPEIELLDTPGVLWPKFESQKDGTILSILGSINDEVVDKDELIDYALDYLRNEYPGLLNQRYGIDESRNDLFEEIAINKKWLSVYGNINKDTAIASILKDLRSNTVGRITWEKLNS